MRKEKKKKRKKKKDKQKKEKIAIDSWIDLIWARSIRTALGGCRHAPVPLSTDVCAREFDSYVFAID